MSNLESFEKLMRVLAKLPGVGRRSAERMTMKLARDRGNLVNHLIASLKEVSESLCACSRCGNLTEKTRDPCLLCTSPSRDGNVLCLVSDAGDIRRIEQSGGYKGRYHALGKKLSPMKGEGVDDLRVGKLLKRIEEEGIQEVILAFDADVESDATASFLADVLAGHKVRVTRIAYGLPAGSGIAYSDPVTLSRAMRARQPPER